MMKILIRTALVGLAILCSGPPIQAAVPERVVLEPGYVIQTSGIREFVGQVCDTDATQCARFKKSADYIGQRMERMIALPNIASDPRLVGKRAKAFIEEICDTNQVSSMGADCGLIFRYDDPEITRRGKQHAAWQLRLSVFMPKTVEGQLKLARLLRQMIAEYPG